MNNSFMQAMSQGEGEDTCMYKVVDRVYSAA